MMRNILQLAALAAGGVLLASCETYPYGTAFNSCEGEANQCYRMCENVPDEAGYVSCQRQCDADMDRCFSTAYSPYSSAYYGSYGYGYPSVWYGRYGAWYPGYGYYFSFNHYDRYGYRRTRGYPWGTGPYRYSPRNRYDYRDRYNYRDSGRYRDNGGHRDRDGDRTRYDRNRQPNTDYRNYPRRTAPGTTAPTPTYRSTPRSAPPSGAAPRGTPAPRTTPRGTPAPRYTPRSAPAPRSAPRSAPMSAPAPQNLPTRSAPRDSGSKPASRDGPSKRDRD